MIVMLHKRSVVLVYWTLRVCSVAHCAQLLKFAWEHNSIACSGVKPSAIKAS
jgi:hypothetical protein